MADGTSPGGGNPVVFPVRKMGFAFSEVPREWFFDSVFTSQTANALSLLFPAGERFFVRSVKHYLPRITNPTLRARVRAFFGQEGSHGHEHERTFEMLEAQGFRIREWLDWYERLAFGRLEPVMPPVMRLSITVALEHFTAALAEVALTRDYFEHAHPQMRRLLLWHSAEELEHKSVAFDVLEEVDGRYWVRMVGLAIAFVVLMGFWQSSAKMLLRQVPGFTKEQLQRERKAAKDRGQDRTALLRAIVPYLRPGFHPDRNDTDALARGYLESIGRLEG
ncbi:metal-dependent hydrolase [Paraliomyxa miuraensis]|uniref:metal-dependent hydrolase n=1 Tax=Paraliomyxa miuraensis TaxID=376150 RepID=UPI0022540E27|nr:metal-dependent hydrolase [Paraliomyxa miuraensis]MCX4244065.1 metal-dependent hydrolase [Paraliomyxa miuraensis]